MNLINLKLHFKERSLTLSRPHVYAVDLNLSRCVTQTQDFLKKLVLHLTFSLKAKKILKLY